MTTPNRYLPDTVQFVAVEVLVSIPAGTAPIVYTTVANIKLGYFLRDTSGQCVPVLAQLAQAAQNGGDIGFMLGPVAPGRYGVYGQVTANPETPLVYLGDIVVGY
jgi:hypothetical protein